MCPLSLYTRLYIIHLRKIGSVVCKIGVSENCPIFFTFSSSHYFIKVILCQPKTPFSWINFFKFGTPIKYFVAYLSLKLGMFKLSLRELWMINGLKIFPETTLLLKVNCFERILNWNKIVGMVNDHLSSCNL